MKPKFIISFIFEKDKLSVESSFYENGVRQGVPYLEEVLEHDPHDRRPSLTRLVEKMEQTNREEKAQ
jgi:hypothetical protein